jgi:hypothetical protein
MIRCFACKVVPPVPDLLLSPRLSPPCYVSLRAVLPVPSLPVSPTFASVLRTLFQGDLSADVVTRWNLDEIVQITSVYHLAVW